MGLPLLRIGGVEADDVIGTLAMQAGRGFQAIRRADFDRRQGHVRSWSARASASSIPMSNTRLDREGVKAKFDVLPEQIVDYLALVGDSSDNIPGVTGVGPKTAAKWLNQYRHGLNALIENAAAITGKVGENLAQRTGRAGTVTQARHHRRQRIR